MFFSKEETNNRYLDSNQLNGTIPTQLGNLSSLKNL